MYKRIQKLEGRDKHTCFIWGPRQTGKSTLLNQLFPAVPYYDLLLADEFERLNKRPAVLREEALASPPGDAPIIVDEIQKVPALLDEIQWLIVNKGMSFILCGSSARKLKRSGANLLGGRALRYEMFPLVSAEIPDFNLLKALNNGLIPLHYMEENSQKLVQSYIGDYLREEIAAEALVRNLPAFGRFLEAAAFSNGEMPVFKNIASDCGVNQVTAKEYFQILEDTLVGRFVPSFQKRPKRRVIQSPKFYYFDVGIANFLLKRGTIQGGGELFGKAFEHFIFQELLAHSHYSGKDYPIAYWRTTTQIEVDFVLGDHEVAIEVKGVGEAACKHIRGLKAFQEEYAVKKAIVVSMDPRPRLMSGITILPWKEFLAQLWSGDIL